MGASLAIDASRNRSGGAVAHMIGLIGAASPEQFGFDSVHVWSYERLLDALPDRPWLVRHAPPELKQHIGAQLAWQRFQLPAELRRFECNIVLNSDAGTVNRFSPAVTMSRDMLSYEPGEMHRYGLSKARLRLIMLREMQNRSLQHADGVIFLTEYASKLIQTSCGTLPNVRIIPHGVNELFRDVAVRRGTTGASLSRPTQHSLRCLYVSNAAPYKHQWHVVRAIEMLRGEGYRVSLQLVGGGTGPAQARLSAQILESDPQRMYISQAAFVGQQELAQHFRAADLFIFASSCENMPNTLVEAMAAGLPIACSARGPMPEVLKDGGLYFDPEDPQSIRLAVRRLIDEPTLQAQSVERSRKYAAAFSWRRCADETLSFLSETWDRFQKSPCASNISRQERQET